MTSGRGKSIYLMEVLTHFQIHKSVANELNNNAEVHR